MKKMLMFAAVAAIASAGAVSAQAPARPQNHQGAQGAQGEHGEHRGMRGGPGRGGMMGGALLKGITLSDAQKAQLEKLRAGERQRMEAQRGQEKARPDFQAIRDARQKGDTATANRLMQEQRAKMEARRDAQVAQIRNILTADQQKQFDANVAEMKQHMGQRGPRGGRPRG
jgi:Spy/CpxP family protein refolding chaperone